MHLGWTYPSTGFLSTARKAPPVLADAPLFKEWKASGEFWLPDDPKTRLWGDVRFVPGDRVALQLNGTFPRGGYDPQRGSYDLLHGQLGNGAPCTLYDATFHVETFWTTQRVHRTLVDGDLVVVGAHLPPQGEFCPKSVHIQFSHLREWLPSPYQLEHDRKNLRTEVAFEPPEFQAQIEHGGESFLLDLHCPTSMPSVAWHDDLEWTWEFHLELTPEVPQTWAWYRTALSALRDCLHLLIGSGVYTLQLNAHLPQADETTDQVAAPVRLFLPVSIPNAVRIEPRYFATQFKEIRDTLPQILATWFEKRANLSVVTNAYTEMLLVDGAFEENIFLRIVQTLEHLHGIVFPVDSKYFTKKRMQEIRELLADLLPDPLPGGQRESAAPDSEHAAWLQRESELRATLLERIPGLNNLSLRSRLEQLYLGIPGSTLSPILSNPNDLKADVVTRLKKITATRHYLTHSNPKQKKDALEGDELRLAASQCWAVLSYWLARQTGFDEEQSRDIALQAKRAMFLIAHRTEL